MEILPRVIVPATQWYEAWSSFTSYFFLNTYKINYKCTSSRFKRAPVSWKKKFTRELVSRNKYPCYISDLKDFEGIEYFNFRRKPTFLCRTSRHIVSLRTSGLIFEKKNTVTLFKARFTEISLNDLVGQQNISMITPNVLLINWCRIVCSNAPLAMLQLVDEPLWYRLHYW